MTDNNGKTFTLAEVRAAFKRGADYGASSFGIPDVEKVARDCYPDPEPERRWVRMSDGDELARDSDGTWWYRYDGRTVERSEYIDADFYKVLALLPRVPVTVTEAMVEKATAAFHTYAGAFRPALRAALEAVAADLAQHATTCTHKATRWGIVDRMGNCLAFPERALAEKHRATWDTVYKDDAPHRVVALAEVEQP